MEQEIDRHVESWSQPGAAKALIGHLGRGDRYLGRKLAEPHHEDVPSRRSVSSRWRKRGVQALLMPAVRGLVGGVSRCGPVRLRRAGRARSGCPRDRRAGSACRRGRVTMSLRNVSPAARSRATSAGDVVDDQVDAVPAARAGRAAVGHRPAGRARRAAEQQPQVAARDVGERGRGAREQLEAEVGGVEGDGGFDVVDHVADVHESRQACSVASCVSGGLFDRREQEADARSRARRRCARTRVASRRRVPARAPGRGCSSGSARGAGELGADLAHPVAEADHAVEALAGELAQVLRAAAGEVDAALAHHPHRVGMQRLGMAAGAARPTAPPDSCSASASAICERALLPVHRNSTRAGARSGSRAARGARSTRRPGMQRRAGARRAARRSGRDRAT